MEKEIKSYEAGKKLTKGQKIYRGIMAGIAIICLVGIVVLVVIL